MSGEFTLAQKNKILKKLFDFGCKTEKDLQALDVESILKMPDVTIMDITIITQLQKQVKSNKLFSYLGGDNSEQQDK